MNQQTDKRTKGKWTPILFGDNKITLWECSECGYKVDLEDGGTYKFCSACGAKMVVDPEGKQEADEMPNVISSPTHYVVNGLECFDVMKTIFGVEAVKTFAKLNAFKYLWRSDRKGGREDLAKAAQYLKMFMEEDDDAERDH